MHRVKLTRYFYDTGLDVAIPAKCTDGDIQLIKNGKPHPYEGRLEVCINNAWGTVCEKSFDALDTEVVCATLGFPRDRGLTYFA